MRFLSQKIGKKIEKSLFSALKSRVWCFGSVKDNIRSPYSKKLLEYFNISFGYQFSKKSLFLLPVTVFSALAIISTVESNADFFKKSDTLIVMPGEVESTMWHYPEHALVHDVDESGVYQSFTKLNSAYFTSHVVNEAGQATENYIDSNHDTESAEANESSTTVTEFESSTDESTESTSVTGSELESDSVQQNTPIPEIPLTSEGETQVESQLQSMSRDFMRFTILADTLLPFAQEEVITSVVEDESSIVESLESVPVVTPSEEVTVIPENNDTSTQVDAVPLEETTSTTTTNASTTSSPSSNTDTDAKVEGDVSDEGILFSDFDLPTLESGQFIKNAQLRISFAGQAFVSEGELAPSVEVEYLEGGKWISAGSIVLTDETSNALNGGYYLFALPGFTDVKQLDSFSVRLRYKGSIDMIQDLYVDSIWVEIATETFDKELLKHRVLPEELEHLKLPDTYEFISSDIDFTRDELPKFSLKYISQRNFAIRFLRELFGKRLAEVDEVSFVNINTGPADFKPKIDVTPEGLFTIQLTEEDKKELRPGEYLVEVTMNEGGKIFRDSFNFQWGMLALNPAQTEYQLGETTTIALGALSPNGNTVCDANLELYIIDPDQFISQVPVTQSGLCNGNNVVDRPDYTAEFVSTIPGTYEMYVERLDEQGEVIAHTHDSFVVKATHNLFIARDGPTRIYPVASYPMKLTVVSTDGFKGKLTEYVPADFVITDTDATIEQIDGAQVLTWNVEIPAGATSTVSYTFNAPDISPLLYTLGPAELLDKDNQTVIQESLPEESQELLAESVIEEVSESDSSFSISSIIDSLFGEEEKTEVTTQETVIEEKKEEVETISSEPVSESTVTESEQEDIVNEPDHKEVDSVTVDGNEEIHTTDPVLSPVDAIQDESNSVIATTTPDASINQEVPKAAQTLAGSFKEHRRWQIASDATGSMIVFWSGSSTNPTGWTCISCASTSTFYGRFPYGGSSYGTTGGTSTHTHTADAVVNQTNGAAVSNSGAPSANNINQIAHTHTFTPTIVATSSLPAYHALRVIQNNNAGDPGTIPAGAVLMFDSTLPSGWVRYSRLDGRYPLGLNATTSSSSNTHAHAATGTLDAAAGTTVTGRSGGTQASPVPSLAGHQHTFSATSTAVNFEPPYIEVIFATSSSATTTPANAIAMWSDTPPAGWLDRSGDSSKPFYNKYIKGSATYGTTGGADTHTMTSFSATTSSSTNVGVGRTGALGVESIHKHSVDLSNFSNASNTPPYVTVIFAKFFGYVPIYDQVGFRFYSNVNSITPTDPWPAGATDVDINEAIDSSFTPVKTNDVVRLRIQLSVSNSTSTGDSFKLQYGSTTNACTDITSWTDVGAFASSTAWIGYDNAGVVDGTTLSSTTITGSDVFGTYEEENFTATTPSDISVGQEGEWDFVLKQNGAEPGVNYCFRMVESDGTTLFSYTQYPMLITNSKPIAPTPDKLFDNEMTATVTPKFEFTTSDPEDDELNYQIQIDDDRTFSSVNIDNDTVNNSDQFLDLTTLSEKDPFPSGDIMRFSLPSPLTNGVTYYWRTRAKDPNASNNWGDWSTIYSFTIDTTATTSKWHQTTEEQFDTDTLSDVDALVTDLVQLATGSTTGTTTSTAIDFLDGTTGNAWGLLSWTDNEAVGDIKYRVQYYDSTTDSWSLVPDADLSGNSAGFDNSPISLLTMDVETYQIIRLVAVLTNSGGTPTLSDWTVAWGYRIDTPTISAPFRNEKIATTTPTFTFTTTDPQGDALEYEVQWSTTSSFTSSSTRNSSTSSGFLDTTDNLDLTPFASGHVIQYSIPLANALTNGTTYWVRVRARDPNGANQYSFYTDAQSFTVDTSVTVSTWFQTTAEQFTTGTYSGAVNLGTTSVTVSTTSVETLIGYAEGVTSTPRYRIWDGTAWSSESSALDVGAAINWVVTRAAPSENEYIMGTLSSDSDVNIQVYQNGTWGNLQEVTTAITNTSMRGFDIAYEQLSGDAIVVTCDGDANPSYWVWSGTTWSLGSTTIGLVNGNTCGWVKLISDPISDEIIAITMSTGGAGYEMRVWNGSSWGNGWRMGSMAQPTHEGIAAEYEDSGNQAVVAVSNGAASSFVWSAWNGTSWAPTTTATATIALGDDFEAGTLVADEGTDNMALCYIDEDADIGVSRWTGSAFTAFNEFFTGWTNAASIYNDRPIDCAFEVSGARDGYITAVYSTSTALASTTWTGAAWSTSRRISNIGASQRVQVRRTNDNILQAVAYSSTTDRYDFTYATSSAIWTTAQQLETDGASGATPFREPFMIAPKNPVTTATVIGDPDGIDFYSGSGPYWQQMSWTDTESGGSSILYQVQYYNAASSTWDLIPDSLIPGNSTGTSTSPIDLSNVLPVSTYSLIRPVANMTCNLGTCPVLQDWTITWSAGITITGTAQGYDQATNTSSGTVAVAVNGTLQVGKTGSISGGTWSISNVNTSPGDVVTVFIEGANDVNEAVAKARYDGVGNMSGLRLYSRHVTLGSDDATTTAFTNANIGLYDFTNDEDLFFDLTGGVLDMCVDVACNDSELYIMASSTYRPTGTSDLNYIENNGTMVLDGNTIYVARSWDNNGTNTSATSTVIFTATSTSESIDETGAVAPSFYNLTFGTTTGSTTWTASTSLDVNNNLTVSRGTFARGTTSITIGGNLTNAATGTWTGVGTTTFDGTVSATWTDLASTSQNVGRVVIDGTSKTVTLGGNVRAQSITIGADDILDASASNHDVTVVTDWTNNNTFTSRSGEVIFVATTTNRTIVAGGDAFYDLTFRGIGGAWSFTEADLTVSNDLVIATGTVTMPTGTTTLAGSFSSVGGTFAHNNATLYLTSSAAETIAASGTPLNNAFRNLSFNGSGSWTFLDASATTTNDFRIFQGTVVFPSTTLSVAGDFAQSGGSFSGGNGTVKFTSATAKTIDVTTSSFNSLLFSGSGSWSFVDASLTALGSVTVSAGTVTFPSGTFTIGGSISNSATITHNNGTVLLSSTDTGETINLGSSPLYNVTVNGVGGGWTITNNATTTNNFTLATSSLFTLSSGQVLSVGGTFTNSVGGASTTWTGSTLSLEAGNYSINSKTTSGDAYGTLRIAASTNIQMWNSSSTAYTVNSSGSLYSQDHSGVDGELYIFGAYTRTSGTEYWNSATDFDGTALGASTRPVTVRFASGASAAFTGSTLSMVGSSTGTTTVTNQGSGTYTIDISGGTTTAQYYDISNLGASGFSLLSANKVTSLRYGSISPGTAGGTGLTVSSTTIDANPQLQIYNLKFSTTSPIVANNVKQIDGAPASYWWFREATGGLSGEANDLDTGNPGSIRWDDSSLALTISGTVYQDDGVTPMGSSTCNGVTQNIRIVVQNGTPSTGSCSAADGTYSIGITVVGSPIITIYLDTNGGRKGTVVTKTPTGNISNMNIYADRVMTRHEDVDALTIADMAVYDATHDSDIQYDAATGTTNTLTVFAGNELHIASSTGFTPGGDITIRGNASSSSQDGSLHIDDYAVFTGTASSTYTIAGSFTLDQGATFTAASTTVVMNATTTGKTITTPSSQTIGFNTLQFTGIGGGWNINGAIQAVQSIAVSTGTVSGTSNITVLNGSMSGNGTVSMGSGTTTINSTNTLGGSTPWTFSNLVLGSGLVSGTTTPGGATTTILGKLTISTAHFLDARGTVWNLSGTGNVFVEDGTFVESTSTVRYSGTAATNVISTTYYNLDLMAAGGAPTFTGTGLGIVVTNNLTIGGATTTTFTLDTNDPALDVNGNLTIGSTGVFQGSGSAVTTIAGNWTNNGSFVGNGGTTTFDGGGSPTISAGNSSFSNVTLAGTGSFTLNQSATTTGNLLFSSVGGFTLSSGQGLAVGGTFSNNVSGALTTWTGSTLHLYGGNYSINASTTNDSYSKLSVAAGTQIRMWNSSASTTSVVSSGSLYSQDNAGVDGDLYIYGAYTKTTGNDYWSYATDFDGSVLGSPRKVNVYVASSSNILYTGGSLSVIGSPAASTTIANQGSGAYAFRIGGSASTTWSYYQLRNLDTNGLTFSGTPTVSTLSYGDIAVSINGATGMTVGGTVITQNTAKTFTNNIFATTSGITTAYNVTATGTSVSSWRFTNHAGDIDGEAFDTDPNGDPGYIAWDDSAALITISGTVYADEGVSTSTACDGSNDIVLRVAGLTTYSTSCSPATGQYSIPGVAYSPGDTFIVYIDGKSQKAATVSEDPISNVGNMDLYENRVIVRHESTDPLSIADMAVWDSSDDADIPFTAVDAGTDTLTLPANRKLLVWTSKTFRPGGDVTLSGAGAGAAYDGTLELYSNATFDATGAESHSVGGSFVSGSGATLDAETSTFTFTTTGAARTIDVNSSSFYNATFNGSGSWTNTDSIFTVNNDLTITQGALTLPTGTTTISGSLSVTGGSFVAGASTMLFNSTGAETVRPGGSNFGYLVFNGTGSFSILGGNATATMNVSILDGAVTGATGTLTIGGNFINADTYTHNSGTLRFISTTTTLVTANGSDFGSTTFAGTGPYTFTDTNVALAGTLTIASGTVTLATGTMSIGGSFLSTGGLFNHSSGTILFNSSDTGETINPGSSNFYVVSLASASGGWTMSGSATTTSNFSLTSASSFTQASSTRLYVGGVFTNLVGGAATTWTGSTLVIDSGTGYTVNTKLVGGDTYNNLIIGSSTALRAWDSAGTITISDSTSSFYSQDHGGVGGALNIYGNYSRTTGADYWSYATDFDGTALVSPATRQVFVSFASNATTTFTGGTLAIIGGSATNTVISNQGSGTYAVRMLGGTLNASYYSFSNMNTDGLYLSGTTTVSSLTEGDFTLAVNGGSLITLSSTTLNYNAGLVITGASFATTTAITGYNVNLVGTTPSSWIFSSHTGNLDGETYDNDGVDACSSIRWDDSSCLLTQQSGYRFRNDDGGEGVPNSEWYNQSWTKRKRVSLTNADATSYTNAVVKMNIAFDSDMQTDFDDLRFTNSDGTTLLSHFTETYVLSSTSVVWVNVPLLATSTVTQIYMYYGNGGVSDGSATSTFNFMDDFEDVNISEYSGPDTAIFNVGTGFAYEGTYGLDAVGNQNAKATHGIGRTDVTISQGQTIRYFQYVDTSGAGAGDEPCTLFGVQSPVSSSLNYAVCLEEQGTDRIALSRDVDFNDTSGTVLASSTITYATAWHEVEIDWGTNNRIGVTVSRNGTVVATTSATSSTYTTGGMGFTFWFQHGGWDIYSVRPMLTTEPSVAFGFEQVSGGASWLTALNTAANSVTIGQTIRPRFLIENTGLVVNNQNYQIEYAEKGASPSCVSVSSASYTAVPTTTPCGTSPICMTPSSNYSNLASTTDILGGTGTFTYGQIVEDPSNKTGNITINSNEYTELEYAITTTATATGTAYCLRVTNQGTPLDSYSKVAEIGLVYEPSVTSLSLNAGQDIVLIAGSTTTVTATGTVTDQNGYADISYATATIYRSGVGDTCTADDNNCYIAGNSQCSFSSCSGYSCEVSCSVDIYYHADPTDIGTYAGETWRAKLTAEDAGGSTATGSAPSIDLLTLRALDVYPGIDYGSVTVSSDTGSYNPTTTIENIGNDPIDTRISGTDLTSGFSVIPVTQALYATSSFTYSSCTYCTVLTSSSTNYQVNLLKPTSTSTLVSRDVFWGIAIPYGVAGSAHSGVNTFSAVQDQ